MKSETNVKAGPFQGQSLRNFCPTLMGVLFLTVLAPQTFGAQGITVCYDYAYFKATGACPQGRYLGAQDLRNLPGYTTYPISNPMSAVGHLRPGDVLITSDGHAGYLTTRVASTISTRSMVTQACSIATRITFRAGAMDTAGSATGMTSPASLTPAITPLRTRPCKWCAGAEARLVLPAVLAAADPAGTSGNSDWV